MTTASEVWFDLATIINGRSAAYAELHEYWTGEQDLPVNSNEFKSRFGVFFTGFRDNLTRPIIEVAEARVRVEEFGDGKGNAEKAWDIWQANNMEVESRWVHTDAMVKGESYVIVLPHEDGSPGIWPQTPEACAVLYSDEDPRLAIAAMKFWVEMVSNHGAETEYIRVNVYFDNRIERYISKSGSKSLDTDFNDYEPFDEGSSDKETTHEVGEVPMYEFRVNYDMTDQEGRSDLTDALPLIDSINKTMLDMMTASEYTAAPQRWATGVEIPLDPQTGEPMKSYQAGADRLWTAPNEQARFGQFASGQLSAYREAVELFVDHLAFITRTPQYALFRMANYPSGESLKTIETPLRSRVVDHQTDFGSTWIKVMTAAMKLASITATLDDVSPRWLPANHPWTTKEFLEELKVKVETLGVPQEMAWSEAGYDASQIEAMKAMRDEEAALEFNAADQAVASLLESGTPPEEAPPAGLAAEQ